MAGVTTHIANAAWSPFYYLKITGLPYYFFATIDPTSSAYGASAWSLPTGMTAIRGMDLPDDSLSQSLRDIIGGVATPERVRLTFKDFVPTSNAGSTTRFFGRLWAQSKATADTSVKISFLASDLAATATSGTFTSVGPDTFVNAAGDVHVGGEVIGYSGVTRSGATNTFTIATRNKYQCITSTYPPTPFYRVAKDETGSLLPSHATPVTGEPLTLIGRTAALFVGAMSPSGLPEAESDALVRLVGRIQSLDYSGGLFTLELESVAADLEGAKVASGLPRATIRNVISLPDSAWRKFSIGANFGGWLGPVVDNQATITVPGSTYSGERGLEVLRDEINYQISLIPDSGYPHAAGEFTAKFMRSIRCDIVRQQDGGPRILFWMKRNKQVISGLGNSGLKRFRFYVMHAAGVANNRWDPDAASPSLLYALGFPPSQVAFDSASGLPKDYAIPDPYAAVDTEETQILAAPEAPASVFIPTIVTNSTTVALQGSNNPSRYFVSSQRAAKEPQATFAWVRFGDGQIARCTGTSSSTNTINTGQRLDAPTVRTIPGLTIGPSRPYYYVPHGGVGTVEQVIVVMSGIAGDLTAAGRALCGTWGWTTTPPGTAGEFDVWQEGAGLGLSALVDQDSFRRGVPVPMSRMHVIDSETEFGELWKAIARENHLFLVWSPTDAKLTIRRLAMPTAAAASTYAFNESNRASANDITETTWDTTHVRTGWSIKMGWKGAAETTIGYTDEWARNAYAVSNKVEAIEDRSIHAYNPEAQRLLAHMASQSAYYRYPWVRGRRRFNKTALSLSPGTFHQLIDATIHNPFTGAYGITNGDAVYVFLTKVDANLAQGEVDCEFLITTLLDGRPWSPCARVDFDAASNGYNAGTKTLTFVRHYTNNSNASTYDGIDFVAGDKVRVITRDQDGAPDYVYDDEIASVAADGLTAVLVTGLGGALSSTVESYMTLQPYTSATAARQLNVSWMGSAVTQKILSTARLNKWQ